MRLTVNPDLCNLCLACVRTCPADMIRERDGRLKIGRVACLGCGHCVAVCPQGAITVDEPGPGDDEYLPVEAPDLTPAQLRRLLLQRRTIRQFEPRPVPREVLQEMLDAARWAPTAANCQCVRFTVITTPALRDEVAAEVTAFYRAYNEALEDRAHSAERLAALGLNPEFGMHPHMLAAVPAFLKNVAGGRDRLFFGAPAVVIVHADRGEVLPATNCRLATFAVVLMAEPLGLGTCLTAYASEALAALPALRARLGIPESHDVHDVFAAGYPAEQFRLVPPRRPSEIDWR
jgi:nitroreductase/NAD-dependent dihydropyrimidine dehydrogenase PreA subunit